MLEIEEKRQQDCIYEDISCKFCICNALKTIIGIIKCLTLLASLCVLKRGGGHLDVVAVGDGCESWTISKVTERRRKATEIWFYRKMLRLSWVQEVTNEVVLEEMKVKRELLSIIRARQWSFVGYLLRENDGMERHIIETGMVSKRARGRQRMRMFDRMTTRLNVCNAKDLGNIAKDKEKSRKGKPCFVNGR